jgi:hypothetical protein
VDDKKYEPKTINLCFRITPELEEEIIRYQKDQLISSKGVATVELVRIGLNKLKIAEEKSAAV